MTKTGETVSFEYNEDGLRTKKTATSTGVTEYTLHGKNIIHMTQGGHELHFYYDAQGKPSIVIYDGTAYGYLYNLQGDVVALVDGAGTKVAEYTYDAWGEPTSKMGTMAGTLGTVQPFRYRGYVYDEETDLYYLRNRYYRPKWCRFVNADSFIPDGILLPESDLYSYCQNNPVVFKDDEGQGLILACILVFAGIGMTAGGLYAAKRSEEELGYVNGWWVVGGIVVGGGAGALVGWGVGAAASALGVALTTGSGGVLGQELYDSWQTAEDALRKAMNSTTDYATRVFSTPYGNRIVDSYNTVTRVIGEAKFGAQSLTQSIQNQIAKDIYLLENGYVSAVEWHFYKSTVSNTGGPSGPLLEALLEAGFRVIFH